MTTPNDNPNNGPISHDYSNASTSNIETTDEEQAKLKALSEMLGVTQQREEIDQLNTSMKYLAEKMSDIAKVIDGQSKILNNLNPNAKPTDNTQDKFMMIGELIEKSAPLLDKLFPKNEAPSLIDNNIIADKMKQTFFDNLETGESINNFIKASLKKAVTKNVINTSLADIGKETISHEPA